MTKETIRANGYDFFVGLFITFAIGLIFTSGAEGLLFLFWIYIGSFILKFFIAPNRNISFVKPSYHVMVHVYDADGKPVDDAVVRCPITAKMEKAGEGWLFYIRRNAIPFRLKTKFHAYIPDSGQWGEIEYTFWSNEQPELLINLRNADALS
ncbi:hypothetical protein K8I31_03965 [bacterium]|nr:hypothetical protein [bacterium]